MLLGSAAGLLYWIDRKCHEPELSRKEFLNNLEVVPQKPNIDESSNTSNKVLKNDPKCLLVIKKEEKISRNERCPSTNKKFKHCCGAL